VISCFQKSHKSANSSKISSYRLGRQAQNSRLCRSCWNY